jgi:hypothetical protein
MSARPALVTGFALYALSLMANQSSFFRRSVARRICSVNNLGDEAQPASAARCLMRAMFEFVGYLKRVTIRLDLRKSRGVGAGRCQMISTR